MAQTLGAISAKDFTILTSPDGITFTDRSGFGTKITPAPGTRKTGQTNTFDGDIPIVTMGKRSGQMFAVEYVYTEGAADLFEIARIAYEAGTDFYFRYAPKGGQTGEFQFTTLAGKIASFEYPTGDANSGDPVVLSFELFVAALTKAVAP